VIPVSQWQLGAFARFFRGWIQIPAWPRNGSLCKLDLLARSQNECLKPQLASRFPRLLWFHRECPLCNSIEFQTAEAGASDGR
jgi:hypothetical protein